jgi:hypothetical protein
VLHPATNSYTLRKPLAIKPEAINNKPQTDTRCDISGLIFIPATGVRLPQEMLFNYFYSNELDQFRFGPAGADFTAVA